MLPDGNGFDLLKELRDAGNKIPVIMLTAWGKPSDVARGLTLGANDYLSKPFTYDVLLARVETMFRNVEQMPEAIEKGRLTLRVRPMEVHIAGQKIKLPPVEFFLLQLFIENEGKALKAETLYEQVWGADMADDPNAVKNTVSRLRKKLEDSGYTVTNMRGEGYRFERSE
jgi:DNA-binding response OmpR family regulator